MRAPLTLAHILGLGILVLGQGVFEAAMHALWGITRSIQRRTTLAEAWGSGAQLGGFVQHMMGRAVIAQLLLAAIISVAAVPLTQVLPGPVDTGAMALTVGGCLVSYSILGHALFLCGVLNSLGLRWAVARSLAAALLVTSLAALLEAAQPTMLSAPVALLIGASLLLVLVAGEVVGKLREGDYTIFLAF